MNPLKPLMPYNGKPFERALARLVSYLFGPKHPQRVVGVGIETSDGTIVFQVMTPYRGKDLVLERIPMHPEQALLFAAKIVECREYIDNVQACARHHQ